ncbi:MAG: hypothetical protein JSU65_10320 [Candidatus Zixiibacteriota bacterium]|nr:MAG: hypothetical protein JSU65_10320 [candidate division Zixibacteria bacterium]
MNDLERLRSRIKTLTNWPSVDRLKVISDTSDCMRIQRGNVIRVGGREFVIEGHRYETRFGIEDQPKYWVFSAIDLETTNKVILKMTFHEEFVVHIGVFKIRCYRSPEKEASVLNLVQGDHRFMQGFTELDDAGNHVRIIDFIRGPSIFQHIHNNSAPHEEYFQRDLPRILHNLSDSMESIKFLHEHDTCHGDIRNDHIIIDSETGKYRWIDFDLNQHVSDFDVWSMGNIISYAAGQGIKSFHVVLQADEFSQKIKRSLGHGDGSAFYEYRIINMRKLFPYIPKRLNNILMHFAIEPRGHYGTMDELISDYRDMLDADFPIPASTVDGRGANAASEDRP